MKLNLSVAVLAAVAMALAASPADAQSKKKKGAKPALCLHIYGQRLLVSGGCGRCGRMQCGLRCARDRRKLPVAAARLSVSALYSCYSLVMRLGSAR
jgi:hypothetical protein